MGIPQIIVLIWTALELCIGGIITDSRCRAKLIFACSGFHVRLNSSFWGLVASSANKKADVNRQLLRFERVSFSRGIF